MIKEYLPKGQNLQNWSEMVTVQSMEGLQKEATVQAFQDKVQSYLIRTCPNLKWKVLSSSENESLYEWSIQGCSSQPDQSEIARIVRTNESIHVWHYVIKQAPMPEEKHKTWKSNLEAIEIVQK